MSKYTINDVAHIIPVQQTTTTIKAIEDYLNNGTIPEYDPCVDCEPNNIRKLISLIQVAERNGFGPKKAKPKPQAKEKAKEDLVEDGYVAGIMSLEEMADIKAKRPEMFTEEELAESEGS